MHLFSQRRWANIVWPSQMDSAAAVARLNKIVASVGIYIFIIDTALWTWVIVSLMREYIYIPVRL